MKYNVKFYHIERCEEYSVSEWEKCHCVCYRDGHMLTALSEVQVNFTEGSVFMSEPTDFLLSAVPVTGAILISGGDCAIHGRLSMNISIQEINENGNRYLSALY